jgi:hypothetical protein
MEPRKRTTRLKKPDDYKLIIFIFESQIKDSKFWLSEWKNLKYASFVLILCTLIVFPSLSITLVVSLFIIQRVFNILINREREILTKIISKIDKENQISQFNL